MPGTGYRIPGHQASTVATNNAFDSIETRRRPGTAAVVGHMQAVTRTGEATPADAHECAYVAAPKDLLRRPLRHDEDALTGSCTDLCCFSPRSVLGQSTPIRRSEMA